MTADPARRLRQKLLDLAIRGKLVPQDPADEPAESLLARMREGRSPSRPERPAALTQRTQSPQRGAKALPPITDDEKPFPIPPNWTWCRLGEIAESFSAKPYQILESKIAKTGRFPVVSQGQKFIDGYCDEESKVCGVMAEPDCQTARHHAVTVDNCGAVGACALPVIVFGDHTRNVKYVDFPFVVGADGTKLFRSFVDPRWTYYWTLHAATIAMESRGYGRHWNVLCGLPIPLPPLAEQGRIAAKVDAMLKAADAVATGMEKIAALKDKARAKILDLAIRGKLVKQDATDEPAERLLARMREGRAPLLGHPLRGRPAAGGYLSRPGMPAALTQRTQSPQRGAKALPPITDAEKPFPLPPGWTWCRLGELGVITGGHTPSMSNPEFWDGDVLWVSSKDMKCKYISDTGKKITQSGAVGLTLLKPGAVLMCTRSGILRRTFPVALAAGELTINQDQRALSPYLPEMSEYIYTALKALEPLILRDYRKTGTTVESIIWEKFVNMPIPLPPLAEQGRIAAKVDAMLAACDALTPGEVA